LTRNIFQNNFAYLGGAGIYFNNKLLLESPIKTNYFNRNKALFAHDFYTFPIRVHFTANNNFMSWINKSKYSLDLVPGVTNINLQFFVVDYYGQTILSLPSRFFLSKIYYNYCSFSYSVMTLKNLKFADVNGRTTINGIIFSSIQNGFIHKYN